MQSFVGRFLQVHTVTMCYGGDLRRQGREAVEAILNEFRDVAAARDALLPRLAIVLFTRSEEHTSELQSPDVISYAVFFLIKTMYSERWRRTVTNRRSRMRVLLLSRS